MKAEYEFATEDKQKARAKLRIEFLRALEALKGSECSITMQDNCKVQGIFNGTNVHIQKLLVKDLHTPIGVTPNCILRAVDVLAVEFKNPPESMDCQPDG